MNYTPEQLAFIDSEMAKLKVTEYRFCIESNQYACDKEGNIYSLYISNQYGITLRVKKISPFICSNGYFYARLRVDGKKKTVRVHRVIANAWYGINNELVVNHKDADKLNNRLENLEFCTQAENVHHAKLNYNKEKIYSCSVFVYLLRTKYGFSISSLVKIFKINNYSLNNAISEAERTLKHFELTDEQVKKCIDELWEMDDSEINKELLKKYLKIC